MRSVDSGMAKLREATGATVDDSRLIGVSLDLTDSGSVTAAAKAIEEAVGAPYALVHNAGIAPVATVEETPMSVWEQTFATSIFGPVALTKALLPGMRKAGRGRIVLLSSAAGVRGIPVTATYSAVKGALERWGESMAGEVASFGIGEWERGQPCSPHGHREKAVEHAVRQVAAQEEHGPGEEAAMIANLGIPCPERLDD